MNFVKIPGKDYQFQTTLVTQKQWENIMGNNPSHFKGDHCLPVEKVSFNDIMEFLARLNEKNDGYTYRLPREEEWEQACRAGTSTDYYFLLKDIDDYCWYLDNSENKTHPVALKKPNPYGLYDMSGLLFEWTSSLYNSNSCCPVLRGGSWDCNALNLRSAFRFSDGPGIRNDFVGFRLLRAIDELNTINCPPYEGENTSLSKALREFKKKRPTFGEVQAFKHGFKKAKE